MSYGNKVCFFYSGEEVLVEGSAGKNIWAKKAIRR